MRLRGRVKPSKPSSTLGFIVGLIFLGLGLFVVIPIFDWFGIFWTGMALVITAFHAVNAFSDDGVATEVFEMDSGQTRTGPFHPAHPSHPTQSVEQRLRKLDQLKAKGVINPEEHQEQRQRILSEL